MDPKLTLTTVAYATLYIGIGVVIAKVATAGFKYAANAVSVQMKKPSAA